MDDGWTDRWSDGWLGERISPCLIALLTPSSCYFHFTWTPPPPPGQQQYYGAASHSWALCSLFLPSPEPWLPELARWDPSSAFSHRLLVSPPPPSPPRPLSLSAPAALPVTPTAARRPAPPSSGSGLARHPLRTRTETAWWRRAQTTPRTSPRPRRSRACSAAAPRSPAAAVARTPR